MTINHMRSITRRQRLAAVIIHVLTCGAFFAASSAPTPLYSAYQQAWGFSSTALTLVFGIYALALMLGLLVTGSLSDHLGRRPVILGALVLEAVAMLVFAGAVDLRMLLIARILQGLASGAAASVLPAAIIDVSHDRAPLINSLTPLLGMGVGALGAGLLIQYAPWPMHLVFIVLFCVFVLQTLASALLPETVSRKQGAWASLIPKLRIPHTARKPMIRVAPANIAAWALGGFYLSLGPSLVRVVSGSGSVVVGASVLCALTVGGAIAMIVFRALAPAAMLLSGAAALSAGLIVTLVGVHAGWVSLLMAGTFLSGMGLGLVFQSALRSVLPQAEAHERSGLMAAYFVISYLAFSIPAMLAGAMAQHFGLQSATDAYGASVIVLATITAFACWQSMRRPPVPRPSPVRKGRE